MLFVREALNAHITMLKPKRSFCGAVNGILGKVLNIASENVILQLIVSKYMPILLNGLEACTEIRQICAH